MSIDLYLRSKKRPARKQIEKVLFGLGFKHDPEHCDKNEYVWFEQYRSVRGCWLDYDVRNLEDSPRGTNIVFHSKTFAGRSYDDLAMQNEVLRKLRKAFEGSIYNPQYGKCCYFDLSDLPILTRAETRCCRYTRYGKASAAS